MTTKSIAIVYYSGSGHNHTMAEAVARGASSVPGVDVSLLRIGGDEIIKGRWSNNAVLEKLTASDAIVFGTPTYMGGPSAQFKAFADATGGIWFTRQWKGKLAGGFSHSNSPAGDKSNTLTYLASFAAQHGMNWINFPELPFMYTGNPEKVNRYGFYTGAVGGTVHQQGQPAMVDPDDLRSAEIFGKHFAESVLRWNASPVPAVV